MAWESEYLGMKFKWNGRQRPEVDCWGLVRLVYLDSFGIDIDPLSDLDAENPKEVLSKVSEIAFKGPWVQVDRATANPFDLVLMRGAYRMPPPDKTMVIGLVHVGVVTSHRQLLHIEKGLLGSVVMPLDHPLITKKIHSFWRYTGKP